MGGLWAIVGRHDGSLCLSTRLDHSAQTGGHTLFTDVSVRVFLDEVYIEVGGL